MGMPNGFEMEIPNNGTNAIVGESKAYNASDLVAGFDYTRGGTAAFDGNLIGSVGNRQWSVIHDLSASGQGAIPAHYRLVKIVITDAGVLGASKAWYHGKS